MWLEHWGLSANPFSGNGSPYVALASHEEAVHRLGYAIESGQSRATLVAEPGMGKSTVLKRALANAVDPRRHIVTVDCPPEDMLLLTSLGERLGHCAAMRRCVDRSAALRVVGRALELYAVQGMQVVIGIDACHRLEPSQRSGVLDTLRLLGAGVKGSLTLIQVGDATLEGPANLGDCWPPIRGINRLTRTETERFIVEKLASAACFDRVFTARAVTRLHALSVGVPRLLERLASLTLMASAMRRMELVTPEVADGVASQVLPEMQSFV